MVSLTKHSPQLIVVKEKTVAMPFAPGPQLHTSRGWVTRESLREQVSHLEEQMRRHIWISEHPSRGAGIRGQKFRLEARQIASESRSGRMHEGEFALMARVRPSNEFRMRKNILLTVKSLPRVCGALNVKICCHISEERSVQSVDLCRNGFSSAWVSSMTMASGEGRVSPISSPDRVSGVKRFEALVLARSPSP